MIEELNERFGLGQNLVFTEHPSGFTQANIATHKCTGAFFLHGAHVSSFRPADSSEDLLFMSQEAIYASGKAIRGGVPVCFPWFSAHPTDATAPAHGLVRTVPWDIVKTKIINDEVSVTLGHTCGVWGIEYRIDWSDTLKLQFAIENRSAAQQSCELALHSYFSVGDVQQIEITGLETCTFRDQLTKTDHSATGKPLRFAAETDRIYYGSTEQIVIHDRALMREISVRPEHSQSTVVWNPWIEKSIRMSDFGDHEFQRMCCIETARITPNQITLPPNGRELISVTIGSRKT
jgi:D-hexose-6-phosphate mutarotase